MKAYELKVNRLTSPMGIDAGAPIFSWVADGGVNQTAFQVKMK